MLNKNKYLPLSTNEYLDSNAIILFQSMVEFTSDKMQAKSEKENEQLIATENVQPPFAPPSYEEATSKSEEANFIPSAPLAPKSETVPSASPLYNHQQGYSPLMGNNQVPITEPPTRFASPYVTEIRGPERIQSAPPDSDDCTSTLLCCSACLDCCSVFVECFKLCEDCES